MRRFCCLAITLLVLFGAVAAQEKEPQTAQDYVNRGLARGEKRDFNGAIADFNTAIALNPNYYQAYFGRGLTRSRKGDLDGAISDFSIAISLNPNYAEAYNSRGA